MVMVVFLKDAKSVEVADCGEESKTCPNAGECGSSASYCQLVLI